MNASVTQGLGRHTLVAGKTTALRLYTDPAVLDAITGVEATVLRADGSAVRVSWPMGGPTLRTT